MNGLAGAKADEPVGGESPPASFLEPFPDVMAHVNGVAAGPAETPVNVPSSEIEGETSSESAVQTAADVPDQVERPAVTDAIGGPLTPDMMPEMISGGQFRGSAGLAEALGPEIGRQIAFGYTPEVSTGPITATLVVESGDTMAGLFTDAGIRYGEALQAIESLGDVWDPRQLRIGQHVDLTFMPSIDGSADTTLVSFAMDLSYDHRLVVARGQDGGFTAQEQAISFDSRLRRASGEINRSLYADGSDAGISAGILAAMTRAFSYDVDFQRGIQPGDLFEAVFEENIDNTGAVVANGDLIYAALTLSGEPIEIYRFARSDGSVDYFTPEGASIRKALLRTPVDAGRISSSFGMRQHPILGYTRMHRGVDFAASSGTPVYAAGDGTIAVAGWNRGYGNYVRIRHNGATQTAYGHLSRFGSGISAGDRIEQGQVIGYVGSTGLATGPHLHYEVLIDGNQVDPLSVELPPGEPLDGDDLERFQAWRSDFDTERLAMASGSSADIAQRP